MNHLAQLHIEEQDHEGSRMLGKQRGILASLQTLVELRNAHYEGTASGADMADRAYHFAAYTALSSAIACLDDLLQQARIDTTATYEALQALRASHRASVADADTVTLPVLQS